MRRTVDITPSVAGNGVLNDVDFSVASRPILRIMGAVDPHKKSQAKATNPPTDGDAAAEIAAARAEAASFREIAARAQADLQNAKVRIDREDSERRQYATEAVILQLLPWVDDFRRAYAHMSSDIASTEWGKGMRAVADDLQKTLQRLGVTVIGSVGEPIDPERHQVLLAGPGTEGTVTEVIAEGYALHGKVLRPANVRAGNGA
jgi:molecular chaperone GrpE